MKLFTAVFIRDLTLMERPAQQKARMGGRDKRKVRRSQERSQSEALTENITVRLDELDNSDECSDEETVLSSLNTSPPL